jgi:hypothetical protein
VCRVSVVPRPERATRVWGQTGGRPAAPKDLGFASAYVFGAVCPSQGKAAALIMPICNTAAMNHHLGEISSQVAPSLGVSRQRNSIAADSLTAKTARCAAPLGRKSLLGVHRGVPLPSSAVASDHISWSRLCRRRPQLGDQHQDFLEHLSRHRDLGLGRARAPHHIREWLVGFLSTASCCFCGYAKKLSKL